MTAVASRVPAKEVRGQVQSAHTLGAWAGTGKGGSSPAWVGTQLCLLLKSRVLLLLLAKGTGTFVPSLVALAMPAISGQRSSASRCPFFVVRSGTSLRLWSTLIDSGGCHQQINPMVSIVTTS